MIPEIPDRKILIQFDGFCHLCSRTVRFILNADKKRKFIFQALQNSTNAVSFDTVIVIDRNKTYQYFDAVLKIGKELGGIYQAVIIFRLLPRKWRFRLYVWIAKNRFRWFGIRSSCYLPTPEEKERFI
jgi:predicted DCC family thiol-disulfide oxidoreductase YuxK